MQLNNGFVVDITKEIKKHKEYEKKYIQVLYFIFAKFKKHNEIKNKGNSNLL